MSKPDKPADCVTSEGEAELRAFRRIASALQRGDIGELAATLGQVPDPVWPWPECYARPKEK